MAKKQKQKAIKGGKELQKKAMTHLNDAKKKFKSAESQVKKYVKTHPEKAALIAASVGVAIGAVLATAIASRKKKQ